jgi:hypothetical protein
MSDFPAVGFAAACTAQSHRLVDTRLRRFEQSQAGADAVVVINVSENTIADQLPDLLHGRSVKEGVIHHQDEISALCLFDQVSRLLGGLSDQNVLAGS